MDVQLDDPTEGAAPQEPDARCAAIRGGKVRVRSAVSIRSGDLRLAIQTTRAFEVPTSRPCRSDRAMPPRDVVKSYRKTVKRCR
jgi:hypothetical protein